MLRSVRDFPLVMLLLALPALPVLAADVVRIGVLADMSGTYADVQGAGSVEATRIAVEEFGGTVLGKKIEVVSADHQNKADLGSNTARNWIDNMDVGLILDLGNSAVAVAVQNLVKEKEPHFYCNRGGQRRTDKQIL